MTGGLSENAPLRRVLIADDEPLVAKSLARSIRARIGCAVTPVESGEAALEALRSGHFDVLITDMLMPGLHGLELLGKVLEEFPRLDVVVMTGYPSEFPYVDAIKLGAADYLIKPYYGGEMEAKLLRLFTIRYLREQLERECEELRREKEEAERARKAETLAEKKYRSLFEMSMNGMTLIDPVTCVIREVNPAFGEMCGVGDLNSLVGRALLEFMEKSAGARLRAALEIFAQSQHGTVADIPLQSGGSEIITDVNISFVGSNGERQALLTFRDVTDQREMSRQLAEVAATDSLTGLGNKRAFETRLENALTLAAHNSEPVCLLFMDLDNFKQCNDSHGHQIGDEVLKRIGALVRKHTRSERDYGFRFGGDEFAVVIRGASAETCASISERLRADYCRGECYGTSMSIGIAQFMPGMDRDALIKRADEALYKAKSAGKNTVCIA